MFPINEPHIRQTLIVDGTLQSCTTAFQPGTGNAGSEFAEGGTSTAAALHTEGLRIVATSILGGLPHEYRLEKIAA
jgi:hypothetical protein